MPSGVFNRAADNWRGLLAIADAASGEWPQRARRALEAARAVVEDDSIRVQLLADVNAVFLERDVDRLPSGELVEALVAIEGRPWAEWKAGKPLSQTGLARLLKPLKIVPDSVRVGDRTPKGYYLIQFEDAFQRYLSQDGGFQPQHRNKADEMGASDVSKVQQRDNFLRLEKPQKTSREAPCCGVAVEKGGEAADHRCNHCGGPGREGDPLNGWDWLGWPDGIWLHARCEVAWRESETGRATSADNYPTR
jgi:hypothetical protein